jgi:DNA-binding transcriptional LysR family regulator
MPRVVSTLKAFHATFPMAQIRVTIESTPAIVEALREGWADLALTAEMGPPANELERHVCGHVDLVAVASPDHPLARKPAPIEAASLRDHAQLVLSDRSTARENREFGVHAVNRWHVTDLHIKLAMLREGLGWGSMPRHLVAKELASGKLVELSLSRWEGIDQMPRLSLVVAHAKDKALGPATRWLIESLKQPM